uniref:(northern house mosquito) hypothetical protein n=1 Tax=Culex pipiens TaxID=7175 RepID=A0A8D8BEA0_CULPI
MPARKRPSGRWSNSPWTSGVRLAPEGGNPLAVRPPSSTGQSCPRPCTGQSVPAGTRHPARGRTWTWRTRRASPPPTVPSARSRPASSSCPADIATLPAIPGRPAAAPATPGPPH